MIQEEPPVSRPTACSNTACILLQPRFSSGANTGAFLRIRAGRCFVVRVDEEYVAACLKPLAYKL